MRQREFLKGILGSCACETVDLVRLTQYLGGYPSRRRRSQRTTSAHREPQPAPSNAAPDGACELLDQRTAVHAGIDLNCRRPRLYQLFKETDYRLLGNSRADHRAGLRRRRMAGGRRQEQTIAPDCDPSAALVRFLLVMNLMLLTSVQRIFTAQTTALAIFTLLALGTFTAGVHVLSWQVCFSARSWRWAFWRLRGLRTRPCLLC
jgi:hypothetical protein